MELRIEGKRINLRKLKKSDALSIYQNANDIDIARYTTLPYPYKLKDTENFIKITHQKIRKNKSFDLGIELKENKMIIGMIGLMNIIFTVSIMVFSLIL